MARRTEIKKRSAFGWQMMFVMGITLVLCGLVAFGGLLGVSAYRRDRDKLAELSMDAEVDLSPMEVVMGETVLEPVYAAFSVILEDLALSSGVLTESIVAERERDAALARELETLAAAAENNRNLSEAAYESIIVSRLGESIYEHSGANSEIMVFELENEDMRGYMAKIRLKTPDALRITLAPMDAGGETTSEAAQAAGALFAVNGGGFSWGTLNAKPVLLPLGNTMIEGELTGDFQPSWNDLAFVGFTRTGSLVGGIFDTEQELLAANAWQGVSFVPMLVEDWSPLAIPSKWANAKQPRTVMGQYPNGDIFFIAVDGRTEGWSVGISLEEMQVLLLRLGVMSAYNLDGGGSTAMYYDGEVLNKPSDGKERKLATNILVMP